MPVIALIGYRACGKTTVGRQVAAQLGYRFVDLDAEIEARIGMPIRNYFSTQGEPSFRLIEHDVLAQTLESADNVLLSTGGGCVLREENRDILREKCSIVIYIRVAIDEIQKRLALNDGDRPSLTGQSIIDEVPKVLAIREPLYSAVAQQVIDGNAPISTVIARVLAIVENLVETPPT